MATAAGAVALSSHSATNKTPLNANRPGTRTEGAIFDPARECSATRRIDTSEVTISIAGRSATPSELRNRASRVALPLTNSAETAAAQIIATIRERELRLISEG